MTVLQRVVGVSKDLTHYLRVVLLSDNRDSKMCSGEEEGAQHRGNEMFLNMLESINLLMSPQGNFIRPSNW